MRLTAKKLAEDIAQCRTTVTEATANCLKLIERHNPAINAIVTLDAAGAAHAMDRA